MSSEGKDKNRDETPSRKADNGSVNRRNILLGTSTLVAAATLSKQLPAGSTGTAAIFTEAVKPTHIIRKVLLRQIAILNYVNPF